MNMLESCAWFHGEPPEILADVLTRLVTDIRRVLVHPDMGNVDKLAGVFAIVDTVAPPPPPGEAALFTRRAEEAAGEPLSVVVDARTADDPSRYPELAADGETALRRDGRLVTAAGVPVAAVTAVYLPGRVPVAAVRLLARTRVPLGTALEPYGVRREELSPDGPRTRGLLWLNGRPVALAWELAL